MSRNSVQVYQFLQQLTSAGPTSAPRIRDQRGSRVAVAPKQPKKKKIFRPQTYLYVSQNGQDKKSTIISSNCRWYQARIVYSILLQSFTNSARSELCSAHSGQTTQLLNCLTNLITNRVGHSMEFHADFDF